MEWFTQWWSSIELSEQILYCIAIPATLILIIQTILVFIGFGHAGEGANFSDTSGMDLGDGTFDGGISGDFSGDIGDISGHGDLSMHGDVSTHGDVGHGDGSAPGDFGSFSLFTVQGIVAFFCVFGWSGIIMVGSGVPFWLTMIIAFILGFGAMAGIAKIIQLSTRLAQNGTFQMKNLLGEVGTVYLTIPADGVSKGKITISVGERFLEFEAVTEDGMKLPDNTAVRVVDIKGGSLLVVEKA